MCDHRDWQGPDNDWLGYGYQVSTPASGLQRTPHEVPKAQMVTEDEPGESYVEGILYTTEWFVEGAPVFIEGDIPAPWPESAKSDPPCHLRILADFMPLSVTIMGFADGDLDQETRLPSDEGSGGLRYECGRVGDRVCVHLNDDGFVEIYPIPAPLLELPNIAALITWPIHPSDMPNDSNNITPHFSQATWLFRFAER